MAGEETSAGAPDTEALAAALDACAQAAGACAQSMIVARRTTDDDKAALEALRQALESARALSWTLTEAAYLILSRLEQKL